MSKKLNYKTIVLTGSETEVKISGKNCDIRNDGIDTVYVGGKAGIIANADGVASIPAGQAMKLLDASGTVYLLGTGSVLLCGNDYAESVFKTAATSSDGGGTVDQTAREAINLHANNAGIHLTADNIAHLIRKPNLLINPDFKINQRGQSEYTGSGYSVDRWYLQNSTNAHLSVKEGYIELSASVNDGLCQLFDPLVGFTESEILTASVLTEEGDLLSTTFEVSKTITAHYFNEIWCVAFGFSTVTNTWNVWLPHTYSTGVHSINVRAVKLERGNSQTLARKTADGKWTLRDAIDPATELVKCQRYFEPIIVNANPYGALPGSIITQGFFKVTKRVVPKLTVLSLNGVDKDAMGLADISSVKVPIRAHAYGSGFHLDYAGLSEDDTTACDTNGNVACTVFANAEI